MRIAVIGAGKIGGTIGQKWEAAGHDVRYGLRDPSKHPRGQRFEAALEGAEVVLLAVPGNAAAAFLREHAAAIDGTLLIDATNSFGGGSASVLRDAAQSVPKARLYRAFNTLGWENFAEPQIGGETVDLFFAGPDGDDRALVAELIRQVGPRAVWVGGPDQVDAVDGLLPLWFSLARRLGRHTAFKLLTDDPRV